jgi:aquaporin Z
MSLLKKAIAEAIGTMVLVVVGCGVAVATGADEVATALAFGLSIVAMAYSIGNVSSCHINPAVSLGFLVAKKMSVKDFFVYVGAQIVGAFAGAGILELIFINQKNCGLGANQVQTLITGSNSTGMSLFLGFLVEVVLTFIFVLAVLGVTSKDENGRIGGFVIGLTLTLVHLLGIPLTGTSVNPARSIGPAIVALANGVTEPAKELWIFILAPLCGAVIAGFVFRYFTNKKETVDTSKAA